jgi:hypothetical protein
MITNKILLLIMSLALSIQGYSQTKNFTAAYETVPESLNVLFIGNSFTFRHDLPNLIKTMVETGYPGLEFNVSRVVYGGRILKDHWRLRTQNFITQSSITIEEQENTIQYLKETIANDPEDKFAPSALRNHQDLLKSLNEGVRQKWDLVVLQSWKDDLDGEKSAYMEYAPIFAELIKAQGGKVVLYDTAPTLHNDTALSSPPDKKAILEMEKHIAALAKKIDATVIPMPTVLLNSQTVHPEFATRHRIDAHPNQRMAYLTACTFYSALFGKSALGHPLDRVKDTKPMEGHPNLDQNGDPIEMIFSDDERYALQQISWKGLTDFHDNNREN